MADINLLKELFAGGYSSGDILGTKRIDDDDTKTRLSEEKKIGGSYTDFYLKGVKPLISSSARIVELGPGRGSWTRALFSTAPEGQIHTIDIQDVKPWLQDIIEAGNGRIVPHQVPADGDPQYNFLADDYFDVFFSFGVFCHLNISHIEAVLNSLRPKLKRDSLCIVQYSDWKKFFSFIADPDTFQMMQWEYEHLLECFPYEVKMAKATGILDKSALFFKKHIMGRYPNSPEHENKCIWTKNDQETMAGLLKKTGYQVIEIDMGYFTRDSVAFFRPIR